MDDCSRDYKSSDRREGLSVLAAMIAGCLFLVIALPIIDNIRLRDAEIARLQAENKALREYNQGMKDGITYSRP